MRSAVSVILSGSAPEQNMSYPDYQQTPNDHQALLVVVRHIGRQLRTKQFSRAFERISRVSQVRISDSHGHVRTIWIRYLRSYPVENNDWGDFQTHRKALGLISIGQCNSQEELNELCRIHESLKVKFAWTLFDSRCILFGLNQDGSIYDGDHSSDVSPSDNHDDAGWKNRKADTNSITTSDTSDTTCTNGNSSKIADSDFHETSSIGTITSQETGDFEDETSEESSSRSRSESVSGSIQYSAMVDSTHDHEHDKDISEEKSESKVLVTPPNFKARTLFYPTMDNSQGLETDIEEFISALFWVLESKRLDKIGLRKADRNLLINSLCAPFEKKEFAGLDLDSKSNKKKAEGRLKKQIGDLSLQAGLASEALNHYQSSIEILKSVNDWLWLAASLEGLCSASVSQLYPLLRRSPTLQRNSSLQGTDLAKFKNLSLNSNSLPHGFDPPADHNAAVQKSMRNCLSPPDILEKYREAITHYGKYRQAGIIETEASIKAALVSIELRDTFEAAGFLQNAVFISLQLTEEEKMQRFSALSDLYTKLGFHRKAAFFKRVAAMRCVSPSNPQPNWALCHTLLLQLLDGYKIPLDPNEWDTTRFFGWPRIQIQVIQELVGTAKRKGNGLLATRHMTLLMHTLLLHVGRDEKREFALQLEALTRENEGLPVPLALDNGVIVPPVHLSHIPFVRVFKPVTPTPHLKADKIEEKKLPLEVSPFVYTPFATNRDKVAKDPSKAEFCWVENELCEVNVLLENPLPIELKVYSMSLITEGVNFQINSNVISIPAESTMFPATLTGKPLAPGNLRILGYSTNTLGVRSNIKLKNMPNTAYPHIDIEIVPSLPCLEVTTSKPTSEFFSPLSDSIVASASVSLMMGECQECTVTLTNSGKVAIETLELSLESSLDSKKSGEIFKWNDVSSQLPIEPGASASFIIYIYGAGEFIGQSEPQEVGGVSEGGGDTSSLSSFQNPSSIEGPPSLPSRFGAAFRSKRTESILSTRSSVKSGSSNNTSMRTPKISISSLKNYEAVLKLKYSGGPGAKTGHFRSCGVSLYVDVSPSLFITKWDTLPGETPTQLYLVLDVCNSTQQEMEVYYAKTKQILIEKNETCRIPVSINRCLQSVIEKGREESICCEHIINNVDLKWVVGEVEGKATLHGIRLTLPMVQLVTFSPIHWEISVNGDHASGEEIRFGAGEAINLVVLLRNDIDEDIVDLTLFLDCYQDFHNERLNNRLDSRFSVIGLDPVYIPKIKSGCTFQHPISFIFFFTGFFKVDFKAKKKTENAIEQANFKMEELVWKYNPPLYFQII